MQHCYGIILTTILIISVFILIASYQNYVVDIVRNEKNWEAELKNIKYAKALEIENYDNIKEVSIFYNIGLADEIINIENNIYSVRINVTSYNDIALNNINLIEGRFPNNDSEIVLSNKININKNVGEKIELTINGIKKQYTIVGIAEGLENEDDLNIYNRVNGALIYYEENNIKADDNVDISILTINVKKIYNTIDNLVKELNLYDSEEEINDNIIYNKTLLNYCLVFDCNNAEQDTIEIMDISETNSSEFSSDLIKIISIVMLIIAIISIILIYTTFSITYNERIKEIGMLSSIGMSRKQIRNMFIKENTILSTIGIIIGEILGTGFTYFVIKLLNIFLGNQIQSNSGSKFQI